MSRKPLSKPSAPLTFSAKQVEALGLSALPMYTLMMGSTQSGKTHVQRWQTLRYLLDFAEPGIAGLLTGVKLDSLKRNFLRKFQELVALTPFADQFRFGVAPLEVEYKPKKVTLYCEGINESGSESKFRGLPIQLWVGDEVPLYDRSSVAHLRGRMSQGSRPMAFLTGNPEGKAHWMYREIVCGNNPDWRVFNFGLDDNPTLTESYKHQLRTAFVGADYQRMVLGEWAGDPERMVIPEFSDARNVVVQHHPRPSHYFPVCGIDLGSRDLTFAVWGYYDFARDLIVVEKELVMRHPNTADIAERVRYTESDIGGNREVYRWCDQDLRFVEDMWALHKLRFTVTRRDDKEAQINALRVLIANGKVRINPELEHLPRHLEGATWNERRTDYERTDSEGHFDGVDALIYMIRNVDRTNPYPPSYSWASGNPDAMISQKAREQEKRAETDWKNALLGRRK